MPIARDLRGYGRERPKFLWPNGARVAVALALNFEEGGEFSGLADRLRAARDGAVRTARERIGRGESADEPLPAHYILIDDEAPVAEPTEAAASSGSVTAAPEVVGAQ